MRPTGRISRRSTPIHSARGAKTGILGLIVILVVVFLPIGYMLWRFKQGEEMVAGGSMGEQMLGRNEDEKPTDEPPAGPSRTGR